MTVFIIILRWPRLTFWHTQLHNGVGHSKVFCRRNCFLSIDRPGFTINLFGILGKHQHSLHPLSCATAYKSATNSAWKTVYGVIQYRGTFLDGRLNCQGRCLDVLCKIDSRLTLLQRIKQTSKSNKRAKETMALMEGWIVREGVDFLLWQSVIFTAKS